jgi:hypothetical protein
VIPIPEATAEAVRLALLRHWSLRLARQSDSPAARRLAGELSRLLSTTPDGAPPEGAEALLAGLARLGLAPPA